MQTQRTKEVLEWLAERELLSVSDAVRMLGVSPATIRRDFRDLAASEVVERVRGGVRMLKSAPGEIAPFELREIQHPLEKQAIAKKAAEMLQPGDVLIVDGGTTTSMLAMCFPNFALRVITNSIGLMDILKRRHHDLPRLEIYMTGGFLYPHSEALLGPTTKAGIALYHARWAFLSVGGISDSGISNTNELVVETERAMIESAETVVVLADHSKVGKHAMCSVGALNQIDILITSRSPENAEMLRRIEAAGVKVIAVDYAAK